MLRLRSVIYWVSLIMFLISVITVTPGAKTEAPKKEATVQPTRHVGNYYV
jgi:hypothetical protein